MSRKERLQLQEEQARAALEAAKGDTPEQDVEEDSEPSFAAPAQDDSSGLRRELEEARREKEQMARERDEWLRERDSYASGLKEKETAAEKAARENAELRAQLEAFQQEKELSLSDEDFAGLDPDAAPIIKRLIEKQSRAISRIEGDRLRKELEKEILAKARTDVLTEVESRQSRSSFDAKLRADGFDDIYDVIGSDDFQQFVKADDLAFMAFSSAANTKDESSARVIKRLVKDFKEKAVKKPAQTPRTGQRVAAVATESDDDSVQINHAQILQMIKSTDHAERKRGKELLDKAAERIAKQLQRPQSAFG